ncbi:MAG: hypothetical protein ACREQR_11300 [Candidatus Binataceae bacterium]
MPRYAVVLALFIWVAARPSRVWSQQKVSYDTLGVSLPQFALPSGKRVVKFECDIQGATILKVKTPVWHMTIDNGSGQAATITANTIVGAAAFTNRDIPYFHDFVTISKPDVPSPYFPPFDIRVTLWISSDPDMTKFSHVTFSQRQLLITPETPSISP